MADFEKMIPFVFHFAAGVYGRNGSDLLLPLERQFELAQRSGWSDDPDDPGGATMIDVTLKTYTAYRKSKGFPSTTNEDLLHISFMEWREILKTMYWDKWRADEIQSQGIANILVDWIWASGPSSISTAQKVIGVKADGIVGPKTIAAINVSLPGRLFFALSRSREAYYTRCRGAKKYLRGWLRRLHAILPDGSFHYQ